MIADLDIAFAIRLLDVVRWWLLIKTEFKSVKRYRFLGKNQIAKAKIINKIRGIARIPSRRSMPRRGGYCSLFSRTVVSPF
jgi:hypothetical protein